jgi:hypothetical protein
MTLAELRTQTSEVVVGTVVKVESKRICAKKDSNRDIVTDVTLTVDRRLAGNGADVISIRVPGGIIGQDSLITDQAPFAVGQRELWFIYPPDGYTDWHPTVNARGRYRLSEANDVGVSDLEKSFAEMIFGKPVTLDEVQAMLSRNGTEQ